MIVVDAHEDLAWNALLFDRDYRRPVEETRRREMNTEIASWSGNTLLGWPEWIEGRVAVIFSTLFAAPMRWKDGDWETLCYETADEAYAIYSAQWEFYQRLFEDDGARFLPVNYRSDLENVLQSWEQGSEEYAPIGFVLLMEGADAVRDIEDLHTWYRKGIRILGLSWARTRYAGGTGEPGPLTTEGHALLEEMDRLGMILDLSHLSPDGALEAFELYEGEVVITHTTPLSCVPNRVKPERHVPEIVIRRIAERDSVLGIVLANHFLKDGWNPSVGREAVTLDDVAICIDAICQQLGSARHVGIGSDFDGGFGLEKVPAGLDSIADLRLIGEALAPRGYADEDIEAILGGNWLRILRRALPEQSTA